MTTPSPDPRSWGVAPHYAGMQALICDLVVPDSAPTSRCGSGSNGPPPRGFCPPRSPPNSGAPYACASGSRRAP
ncbi:hypothetical protein ACFV4F_13855 [Kitasatospora sp. NPDC059722]|uniref:hypothetical protein n=1 Tax=Kitasatospora sp. NPDC059722 TaxID=3346925 RepID=UPI00368893D2